MALGNQNLYGRFSAANPDRRLTLPCPQGTVSTLWVTVCSLPYNRRSSSKSVKSIWIC
jgi:hypothetical protein